MVTKDELEVAKERLAKLPPRPWTNPWEENEDGEAEAIRDAEGKVVIGLGYYDGYHLELDIEVCQIILAIINTLYPATLKALEEARERIAALEDKIRTHHLVPKGYHDVENFYLEEEVDESGQSYGRCMICGMPYQIVRPGKGQPACECEKTAAEEEEKDG